MLLGEHIHALDAKKRMSLPVQFRKALGNDIVITRGLDTCLFIYSKKEWRTFSEKLAGLSVGSAQTRAFSRFMLAGAYETTIDKAGRILVPETLKRFAQLTSKVVVAGMHNRIELWNLSAWESYQKELEKNADHLAQQLGDIGMI